MENVGLFFFALVSQVETVESRIGERPIIVADFIAGERGDGINSYAEFIMCIGLEEGQRIRIKFASLSEIVRITDLRKLCTFLLTGKSREIVDFLCVDARNIAPGVH